MHCRGLCNRRSVNNDLRFFKSHTSIVWGTAAVRGVFGVGCGEGNEDYVRCNIFPPPPAAAI